MVFLSQIGIEIYILAISSNNAFFYVFFFDVIDQSFEQEKGIQCIFFKQINRIEWHWIEWLYMNFFLKTLKNLMSQESEGMDIKVGIQLQNKNENIKFDRIFCAK